MARQQGDEGLQIRFFVSHEFSEFQSASKGKDVYVDIENIQIFVPGMRDTVSRQITDEDKDRFKDEYLAWKKELKAPIQGMPLDQWPGASVDLIEGLKGAGVRSVEDLIAIQESYIQSIPGALTARTRAIAQADAAANVAEITSTIKQRDDLLIEVELQKKQIVDRDATIAALQADLEEATKPKPSK